MLAPAAPVSADWLVTPFIGAKVDAKTNLVDLDQASGATKPVLGVSVSHVTPGLIGLEGDAAYMPGFFDSSSRGGLVSSSRVVTMTGQVLLLAPAAMMRDSLRPYATVGGGWMHVGMSDLRGLLGLSDNFAAMSVGVGATGRTGRRSSIRFDLRRLQTVTQGHARIVGFDGPRLSFWRASVGLSLHY